MLTIFIGLLCFCAGGIVGMITTAMLSASSVDARVSEIEKELFLKYNHKE